MAGKKKAELAVIDDFRLVSRWDGVDEETMAEIAEELESLGPGTGISCRKIKVPSGGLLAYEVEGEDRNDVEYMKEIHCVILYNHLMNAYWPNPYGTSKDENKLPVCSSLDGKTGVNIDTGEARQCDFCPYNDYGTGVDRNGARTAGKACKNMRRIYLMKSGDPNVYLLTVPPTSLKDVKEQLDKALSKARLPLWKQVVTLSLEKAANKAGTEYSKVVLSPCGLLSPDASAFSKSVRAEINQQYQSMAITLDEYNAPAQLGPGSRTPPPPAPSVDAAPPLPNDADAPPAFEDAPSVDGGDGDDDLPFA